MGLRLATASPSGVETASLFTQWLYLLSVVAPRPHAVGDLNVLIDRVRAAELIAQPGNKTEPKRAS
jgi:hypothetical protein